MEIAFLLYTSLTILLLLLLTHKFVAPRKYHLPPSPAAALPLLGHLHLLKQPLHRTFHSLAQTTGPIFSLKLGVRRCVVVSSPNLVEQCFTEHDIVLCNRPNTLVDKYIGYNHQSMVGSPYGEHWRGLRRIAAQELLSTASLNRHLHIRRDEINRLLVSLYRVSNQGFSKVKLRPKLSELTFNVMMRMIAGKRYWGEDEESEDGEKFRKLINEVFEMAEASNPQDFLPFLQWIDYGGFTKKLASLTKQMDEFFNCLIEEHRQEKKKNTMIGNLLSLQESQPEFYSDHTIKGLIQRMIQFLPIKTARIRYCTVLDSPEFGPDIPGSSFIPLFMY